MVKLQEQDIPTIILLGTVGILLLIGAIGLFMLAYQKRVLREKQRMSEQELDFQNRMIKLQLESQEHERKRIGADLHDSLGSLFWGAKVNASFIQRSIPMNEEIVGSFKDLSQILDEGVEVVRRIAWELTPETFQYSGLSISVSKLCERFNGKAMEIIFCENEARLWNDDRALQVFRVIQELISNAIKHSGASVLDITFIWFESEIHIKVRDNGSGIGNAAGQNGVGMWNINQRIRQLQGEIKIGHPPIGSGVQVDLRIPLKL